MSATDERARTPDLRVVDPAVRRRRLRSAVIEITLIIGLYVVYSTIRNALPLDAAAAFDNAKAVLQIERSLGIDWELPANLWAASNHAFAVVANYYYAICHFVFTIGLLLVLWWRDRAVYLWARNALLVTTGVALVAFALFPMAPPRLMSAEGYVDTFLVFGTWGSLSEGTMSEVTNQYAAMPSLHVAWSVWFAWVLWRTARRQWVRVLGVVHPVLTTAVVILTANHFVLDVVGGLAAVWVGFAVPYAARRYDACARSQERVADSGTA